MPVPLSEKSIFEQLNLHRGALRAGEVARLLGLKPVTIYKYVRNGTLPYFRVGRAVRFDGPTLARALKAAQV